MDPPQELEIPDLREMPVDLLRRVIETYLRLAYPGGDVPEPTRHRLSWMTGNRDKVDVSHPPFEPLSLSSRGLPTVVALRLGNHRYPHMKLQIQGWPTDTGFLLSVNTHDQVLAPEPDSPEAEGFRQLQEENQRIKLAIEGAWESEGLPTFLGYLKEYVGQTQPRSG